MKKKQKKFQILKKKAKIFLIFKKIRHRTFHGGEEEIDSRTKDIRKQLISESDTEWDEEYR